MSTQMNPFSGGLGPKADDVTGKGGSDAVSLEAFITANWQILTIFGVFAGFTNYLSSTENTWLITLGFLLTFIVELEILQLLLRIKNRSFLLSLFTMLSAVFILFFAGFIYSNLISNVFSGFGLAIYPLILENRVLLVRIIFLVSSLVVVLGVFSRLRSMLNETSKLPAGRTKTLIVRFLAFIVFLGAVACFLWLYRPVNEPQAPAQTTTTTIAQCPDSLSRIGQDCCQDENADGLCDDKQEVTTTTAATTTSTQPDWVCTTNGDCGNQTQIRLCHNGDVYIQQTTPLCQKPATADARCVYKTSLAGETMTQEANPLERCSRGCKDGECITRP
jgi:hypothetical protein